MVHIGYLIKKELDRQMRSASWFAQQIGCERGNVYKIFAKQSINTDTLSSICRILNYNFFEELSSEASKSLSSTMFSDQENV